MRISHPGGPAGSVSYLAFAGRQFEFGPASANASMTICYYFTDRTQLIEDGVTKIGLQSTMVFFINGITHVRERISKTSAICSTAGPSSAQHHLLWPPKRLAIGQLIVMHCLKPSWAEDERDAMSVQEMAWSADMTQ